MRSFMGHCSVFGLSAGSGCEIRCWVHVLKTYSASDLCVGQHVKSQSKQSLCRHNYSINSNDGDDDDDDDDDDNDDGDNVVSCSP